MKSETLKRMWHKYRYACLILLVGMILLAMPGKSSQTGEKTEHAVSETIPNVEQAEERLSEILQSIRGVGEVRVLLSCKTSEERVYTKDEGQTVLLNVGSGTQEPLEKKIVYPVYLGAVIVCSGAGDAAVTSRILEAVHQYTGLRSDQISVLPMEADEPS